MIENVGYFQNLIKYPIDIQSLPFCCWRRDANKCKIPYDPKTQNRASVSDSSTFGTLKEALTAFAKFHKRFHYEGIAVKISKNIGCIDLDKCVSKDVAYGFEPITSDNVKLQALIAIALFPQAVIEFSPSKSGLHIFFKVPDGFSFDKEEYYINNRNKGIEVYIPSVTNRYMTVTGDVLTPENRLQAVEALRSLIAKDGTKDGTKDGIKDGTKCGKNSSKIDKIDDAIKTLLKKEFEKGSNFEGSTFEGSICNTGVYDDAPDGAVSLEALTAFINLFMKRLSAKIVQIAKIQLPKGGSILSDDNVILIASRSQNGDYFMELFKGNWESIPQRFGSNSNARSNTRSNWLNWSHSEADLALCGKLAFFCRGDIAQMDRLFRKSGLMRDKWDRPQGDSTYGILTMTTAIAGCSSFYESQDPAMKPITEEELNLMFSDKQNKQNKQNKRDAQSAQISAKSEETARSERSERSEQSTEAAEVTTSITGVTTNATANIANIDVTHFTLVDRFKAVLSNITACSEPTEEMILSEDALLAAAWFLKNDAINYIKFRKIGEKLLGRRFYDNQVKSVMPKLKALLLALSEQDEDDDDDADDADNANGANGANGGAKKMPKLPLLNLSGVDCLGLYIPKNWSVSNSGIVFIEGDGKEHRLSTEPIFINSKLINVDNNYEKLSLTYRANGSYRTLIIPRANAMNKNKILDYADDGLQVKYSNATLMTDYIADFEAANKIPIIRCIRRAGWVGEREFFPFYVNASKGQILSQEEGGGGSVILDNLIAVGLFAEWLATAIKVRRLPFARAMMAASFASPLLYKLQQRNIYYHSWGHSGSGKTASLNFAMSIWGNPKALYQSYFSTMVGIEHRAGTLRNLPLALDELQSIDKKLDLNNLVYTLGNGVGKTRGKAKGGIRDVEGWQNCILSTGEQPISRRCSMNGMNTRLFEVYARPVPNKALGAEMHRVSERNYGFAGQMYIKFIMENALRPIQIAPIQTTDDSHQSSQSSQDVDAATSAFSVSSAETNTRIAAGTAGTASTETILNCNSDEKHSEHSQYGQYGDDIVEDANSTASRNTRLFSDLDKIHSTLNILYADTNNKLDDIATLCLADYYASISVFSLSEAEAWQEAIELGGVLLQNQNRRERKDTVDQAWDHICGWVVSNKNKFSDISLNQVYGKIKGNECLVLTSLLDKALTDAGFTSEEQCITGFGERGYIKTRKNKQGNICYDFVRRILGSNTKVYVLNMDNLPDENTDENTDEDSFEGSFENSFDGCFDGCLSGVNSKEGDENPLV